ncbi:MAG: GAF domain-containing SpoIIE family protein phosphatase [Phycisphaerae bacterium]
MNERTNENSDLTNAMAILDVARRIGLSYDLDELLDKIVSETASVLNCERATLFLYDPGQKELYSKIAHGTGQIRVSIDHGIVGACARSGQLINIPDAYADPRFHQEVDLKTGYRTRNILSCPLVGHKKQLVGVLQAINRRWGVFSSTDEWLLETLSSQAAVAIQRTYLLSVHEEKQRMEHELNLAREIQLGLLPKESPKIRGYQIAGWNRPADQTGGDCYDFLITDENDPGILLADASGHGIAPALVVAQLRAILRALSGTSMPLPQIMSRVNNILCRDLPGDRFVTAFFGMLSSSKHELIYCSAGQAPLLHVKPAKKVVHTLMANACPLGIIEGMSFPVADPIKFDPGDIFLLVTDGFFEWTNSAGEQFGIERLEKLALTLANLPAEQFIDQLRNRVEQFGESTPQKDDLTAVVIKRIK